MQMLIDLHIDGERQGPGSDEKTRLAVTLSGLSDTPNLKIADIGCGTGASTLVLADALDAHITAVDFLPSFLQRLDQAAQKAGVADRINTLEKSMDDLPFEDQSLDAIWSEGAIYNMGFEAGVKAWRSFLKPGGILAVSELTWITDERPAELQTHWDAAYPQVDTASAKTAILEKNGFAPIGYFVLPADCWLDHYYRPMQGRFNALLEAYGHADAVKAFVAEGEAEIALYEKYRAYVSYGYYIARKVAER